MAKYNTMIGADRIDLNNRFIKVFQILENRGAIVKNDRSGRGIGDVAEKILGNKGYGHIIRAYLNEDDKRVISYSQARQFCLEYGVNEDYLLDGRGTPFGLDIRRRDLAPASGTGNILFTTAEAFAGATTGAESFTRESNSFFTIPDLRGSGFVAFQINGNSMEPAIQDGDIVVCREVDRLDDVRENKIYAVRNNGKLWVKYVQLVHHGNRVTHLKLISANYLEHDPFVEEVNVHTRLYQVVRRISNL